jgi:ubiquinone/menaquinone biosynthesis C-methylase UbiE
MDKLKAISKIRNLYREGRNLMEFLRSGETVNDPESIMISYDFQAGSYIQNASQNREYFDRYTQMIQAELAILGTFSSIMEVGVGEATVMAQLMQKLDPDNTLQKFGFDISWSRVRHAKQYTQTFGQNISFFTANLFEIPLADNSIDIVYTSHSLEPNGGKEKEALRELFRVASKYVVLLEPDYSRASAEARTRMERHGYVKNLAAAAQEEGMEVLVDKAASVYINPLNPTGITILRKHGATGQIRFVCPITGESLKPDSQAMHSEEAGLLYPLIDGIPCLLSGNAILATQYANFKR